MYHYANKKVKLFVFDGLMAIPLIFLFIKPSIWVFSILMLLSITLLVLSNRGMDLHMLLRKARTSMIGNRRHIRPTTRELL
nr:IcmT/TraK family protein [Vibrio splendidus]